MIRLQQLRIPVGHTEDALRRAAAAALGIAVEEIRALRVHRQGVDARHPRQIYFIYSLDLETTDETAVLSGSRPNVAAVTEAPYAFSPRPPAFARRPLIVGTGPAGLFAGLLLARAGARPIFLERGQPIEARVKDVAGLVSGGILKPESNIQFGEGGAGTFSDGKLNSSISDPRCRWVLEQLVAAGAPPDILTKAKPHVGTDRIRETVKRMRRDIQGM
ncbi:MAG TPA: FAD-dependent monooxygenase, partial [Elusimicrobiota bacterium]|nr:FAD-dependent monooxygenase [Elusimicrobiota bacterium]